MRNPFSPHGRTRRLNYALGLVVINVVGISARGLVTGTTPAEAAFGFVVTAFLLWPLYCLMTRRLHDADRTSIQAILTLSCALVATFFAGLSGTLSAPNGAAQIIAGAAALMLVASSLIMMTMPPTRGANRYGPDPRRPVDNVRSEEVIA